LVQPQQRKFWKCDQKHCILFSRAEKGFGFATKSTVFCSAAQRKIVELRAKTLHLVCRAWLSVACVACLPVVCGAWLSVVCVAACLLFVVLGCMLFVVLGCLLFVLFGFLLSTHQHITVNINT
jgi:hypothetical protein